MAVVYPLANGNWSTVANWYSGGSPYGSLPLSGDDVYADGKTVTIDTNVTVLSLTNGLRSGGTTGGYFQVINSGFTITATTLLSGTATNSLLYVSTTVTINGNIPYTVHNRTVVELGGGSLIFNGNVAAGGTNGYGHGISVNGANTLLTLTGNLTNQSGNVYPSAVLVQSSARAIINGIVTGPNVSNAAATFFNNSLNATGSIINGLCISGTSASPAVFNIAASFTTINGNQTAAGAAGVYAIQNASNATITIIGDLLGALSSAPSSAFIVQNNGAGILNINGSVIQRNVGFSATLGIVNNNGTGTINISQNVTGGSVINTIAVSNASTGTINIGGNITGGSIASNSPAIFSTTAGTIDVTGTTTAGLYPALWSTSLTATNILRGNITNALGVPAYNAYKITVSPTAVQTATMQTTTNVDRLFSTSNVSVGAPATTNVRAGVVYGSTNELTGTMIVPTPANVRNGVPTDNTVGTADLTIAEFWDINASTLTTTGSIGDRVRNCSTVDVTGNQIAAFNS